MLTFVRFMVRFERFTLDNGLRVIVHEDTTTPMAVLNVLYDVGARDEEPDKTGFAHLFEHLMFGGSVHIPSYDEPLQRVGGENNAFTTNDVTNYYVQLPAENIETAFWLESDRMLDLAFSPQSLEVQRQVVCEEFKQRYLNQPYGDMWLRLRPLAYKRHPYRWATIGKELAHIENASMEDVKAFFKKHYHPGNAVLVVAGNISVPRVAALAKKWFAPIPAGDKQVRNLPQEPVQTAARNEKVQGDVPLDAVYKSWHMGARGSERYYAADLLSDLLARGTSARLFRSLVKEKKLFSEINSYVTGSLDPGQLIVEGKLVRGVLMEDAEHAVEEEIRKLVDEPVPERELTKVKNKVESTVAFAEMNLLDKAMNLAYFELMGDAGLFNAETARYRQVSPEVVQKEASRIFRPENSSTLYYFTKDSA